MKTLKPFSIATICIALCSFAMPGDLRRQLIGEWRNVTLHVDVITANGTDKNTVWESNEGNWEERLHIKPIRTFFKDDNTFYSEYYNLKDSLIYRPTGKWDLKGNKLTFYYLKPKADTLYFTLSITNGIATFKGKLDWDEDGKKDDLYAGTQRKQ
ncbi:MAG: hypothetical protein ACXVPQ_07670 [Bacteroidia bacterium]